MLHTPVQGQPTETPFAVYLDAAKAQVAASRTKGELEHAIHHDVDMAINLAILNRDSDRSERARSVSRVAA